MAFLPEDGTGLDLANSYIVEQLFRDHHADRGRDVTTLTQTVVETALVRATDYIDKRFGRRFRGIRIKKSQGLEWPRLDAFDNDDFLLNEIDQVPRQLQKATAEYALRAILYATELAPDPLRPTPPQDLSGPTFAPATGDVVSGMVRRKEEEVFQAVRESTTYTTSAQQQAEMRDKMNLSSLVSGVSIPEYPEADMWLEELITPPAQRRLVRGS